MASLTHGFGNGLARGPTSSPSSTGSAAENLAAIGATVERATASTATSSRPASSTWRTRPHQVDELPRRRRTPGAPAHDVELLDADARAGRGATRRRTSAALRDRTAPRWSSRPGWPGACGRPAWTLGVRIHERHPVTGAGARRRRADRSRTGGRRACARRRVALATNAFPPLLRRLRLMTVPVYDYVLMTEPLTTDAAGVDRLGRPARASATPPTSSTTTGSPATTGSCGAATTRSTTTAAGSPASSSSAPRPTRCSPSTSSRRSRSSRALRFTPPLGRRDRHLHPVLRRSSARRTTAGSAYALGYTGLGVGATASAPR